MKMPTARILVTCTKRKRGDCNTQLHLGAEATGTPEDVAQRWTRRLENCRAAKVRASSLYAGDHWQVAASLPAAAATCGVKAELWVLSAGYGLIPGSAPIAPYSATFSVGHQDHVLARFNEQGGRQAVREWWASLAKWEGPTPNQPRTITNLARLAPSAPMVVVASPHYLAAALDDLVSARAALSEPNLLIVVSAGARGKGPLAHNTIDFSSRYQSSLGGALMSLNARVARSLIEKCPPYPWTVQGFQTLLESLPINATTSDAPTRHGVTDEDVRGYVRKALQGNPKARHTTLLRLYREAGYACEQKRFRRLFKEVERSHARTD